MLLSLDYTLRNSLTPPGSGRSIPVKLPEQVPVMVRPHVWRSSASALTLAVCGASLAPGLGTPGRALASGRFTSPPAATSSSLTIAGGVEPIARLLDLDPEGPRSLFLVQVIRRIHDAPWGARENAADLLPGLLRYLDSPDWLRSAVADQVPLLLPPDVWSGLVLRRAAPSSDLLTAILRDRKASLLYHGLYALDDETLGFLASRDETLRRIYGRSAPAFATLARSIRIENGELIVPGGPELRPAWESLVGESCATPDRFLTALFERDEGRLAFLFDTLANVSHAQLRFATRSANRDPLRALYQTFRKADPGWKIERRPFARTAFDAATLLMSVEVTPDGELIGPRSRSLWQAVFADAATTRARRNADCATFRFKTTSRRRGWRHKSAWRSRSFASSVSNRCGSASVCLPRRRRRSCRACWSAFAASAAIQCSCGPWTGSVFGIPGSTPGRLASCPGCEASTSRAGRARRSPGSNRRWRSSSD